MTRSGTSRLLVVLALVVALVAAGCGGGGSSGGGSSAKVPPKTYLNKVCTSLQGYFRALQGSGADLQASLSGSAKPAQGKQALTSFLGKLVNKTDQLVTSVRNAGVPDTKNGQQVQNNLVGGLQAAKRSFQRAHDQAAKLPTDNKAHFVKGTEQLARTLTSSGQQISASFSRINSPELERLASKNPKCRAISSGG